MNKTRYIIQEAKSQVTVMVISWALDPQFINFRFCFGCDTWVI